MQIQSKRVQIRNIYLILRKQNDSTSKAELAFTRYWAKTDSNFENSRKFLVFSKSSSKGVTTSQQEMFVDYDKSNVNVGFLEPHTNRKGNNYGNPRIWENKVK